MKRIACFLLCFCFYISTQSVRAMDVPEVESEFVYIYNLDDAQIIYEKKAQDLIYPASMTKIMTTLVVLEQIQDLQTMILVTSQALEGLSEQSASVAGFKAGELVSVEDLLYGVMLPSGADATRALALHISGSEEAFVQLMNEKAKDLQLNKTHFINTSGLHHDDHYSTVQEIGIILQEALKNETFKKLFSTDQYTTKPTNLHPYGLPLVSTKLKLMYVSGLTSSLSDITMMRGGKTGFTLQGGLCLASILEINNASYIVVTANAGQYPEQAQHLKDTFALGEYLKSTYSKEDVFKAGEVVGTAKVTLGVQTRVDATIKEDISIFKKKQDAFRYEVEIDNITAPVSQGQEIGTLKLYVEGNVRQEIPLTANQDIQFNWKLILIVGGGTILVISGVITFIIHKKRNKKEVVENEICEP